ncbi:hypothetical protein GQ43DRAFT_445381 [Delitschia confertaspora ATCC 74209]|uniref:Uncharacterized protein n=1 Tax=Delitschia confertaspora ATCC 74209 TaxID=1513339 RepID=A0A9P4MMI7_9PLEO|nr:hypothetical protein GQ43DRAFT_445381 [Delitschia confertaspora ATCC 74209]
MAVRCCSFCSDIIDDLDIGTTFNASLADIRTSAGSCSICKILLRASEPYLSNSDQYIFLNRTRSALTAGRNGPRLLRFSTDPVTTGVTAHMPV